MLEELLKQLNATRHEHAQVNLSAPREKTEFEFGRVSGMYQGLSVAITAIEELMMRKEEDD